VKSFSHLFFDLDRTLWDFDSNSRDALLEIIDHHRLAELGVDDAEAFITRYKQLNEHYWELYRQHKIDKATLRDIRFKKALEAHGIVNDALAHQMAQMYITISPLKTKLLPGTIDVLEYLCENYALHIITNGFEEVQHIKMQHSGLNPFFRSVITSERAGHKKPSIEIFQFAFAESGARAQNSIMIGDDFHADIIGAKTAGMSQIFFNVDNLVHDEDISHEIRSISELRNIL
jgi:putative hydrolase of the HAD superfamily